MMIIKKVPFLFLSLSIFVWIGTISWAKNNSSFSLGIFPPIITVRLKPGASVRQPIRVFNNSPEKIYLKTKIKMFNKTTSLGQPLWSETPLPNWLKIRGPIDPNKQAYPIDAQSHRDFLLILQPPADVALSDYYFSIIFYQLPENNRQVNLQTAIATNILLTLDPKLKINLKPPLISKFEAPTFVDSWTSTIPIKAELYNPNPHWLEVLPTLKLEPFLALTHQPTYLNLIPVTIIARNTKRLIVTEKDINLALMKQRVIDTSKHKKNPIQLLKDKFFSRQDIKTANNLFISSDSFKLGIYKLKLNIETGQQSSNQEKLIVFFPWKLSLAIAFLSPFVFISLRKKDDLSQEDN